MFALETQDQQLASHGRMFAPAIGIDEDPVTGNANGPLGAYLVFHGLLSPSTGSSTAEFTAWQGEAMGRQGSMQVFVDVENNMPRQVRIQGRAVTVFETVIPIQENP